ncbi:NUDIX domain-containing protein [Rapidithrix thailandica]|uniref:NUDIX domain-containing protein n=1 Tax=Rapidithrix thailandica TaxID=413964 RepID=A0AAW9RVJ7_9BACT
MRIFVNEHTFNILDASQQATLTGDEYVLGKADAQQIWTHYEMAKNGTLRGGANMVFLVDDYDKVIEQIHTFFTFIDAAGGIVLQQDKLLFMKRRGKWDLPKGKVDEGESIETAATREVMEECGVQVELQDKLGKTYHTYTQNDQDIIKCTHWFLMNCVEDSQMQPQVEEDIEELRWFDRTQVEAIVFNNTFQSIKEIYEVYIAKH